LNRHLPLPLSFLLGGGIGDGLLANRTGQGILGRYPEWPKSHQQKAKG
jgi:hypothetical protein